MQTARVKTMILPLVTGLLLIALQATGGEGSNMILSRNTPLRTWMVSRTPVVIGADGKLKPAFTPKGTTKKFKLVKVRDFQSPLPPASWREVKFDDYRWSQRKVPVEKQRGRPSGRRLDALHSATDSAMICARARFEVTDPSKAGQLRLSVTYVGGLAVFLNGKELTRRHLPEGKLGPETLAEKYPDDLYITADGKYMQHYNKRDNKRFARRYRQLENFVVPASALKKGLNVLALQVHRAPVNEPATKIERRVSGGMTRVYGLWAYAGLTNLTLSSTPGAAIVPNVGQRSSGIEVWNCRPFDTITVGSYGEPGDAPGPVEIDALRNGVFSGRFVISADRDIKELKVVISELAGKDGKASLPREAVMLRHGRRARAAETRRPGHLFDGLLPGVPTEVKHVTMTLGRRSKKTLKGAVLPVWISVRPPKDIAPGLYEGKVTVTAQGLDKTVLPLRVRIHGWTLPDPDKWRVENLSVFSPYHLAGSYKVRIWSEEHWKLVEESFRLMSEISARRVPVDLVPGARYLSKVPLEWSMFRLVPKKDGKGYDYDFSTIDRLFDLVEKTMKSPNPLSINCWGEDNWWKEGDKSKGRGFDWRNSTLTVPVLDPKTGKLTSIRNPKPGTEECYKFWKPILDQLRKRIDKRGWFASTAIMHETYCWPPNRKQVDIALRIWPDAAYGFTAHSGTLGAHFGGSKGKMPVKWSECVWTAGKSEHRGWRRLLKPGRDKWVWNYTHRDVLRDRSTLKTYLVACESNTLRGHDGLGYLCADFVPMHNPKSRRQPYYHIEANRGGTLGYSTPALLAAGPQGPVATGRYEMFREGCQQSETILYLERQLQKKAITGEPAKLANDYLNERSRTVRSSYPYDRQDLDRRLFKVAAEVAAASGG